jgi:hypothetical protein
MPEIEEVPTGLLPDAPSALPEAPPEAVKKRKGVIRSAIVGVVAFILGTTLGVAGSGNADELEAARSHAADLSNDLETAQSDLADARTEIGTFNEQVITFEDRIAALMSEASRLEEQISDLRGQVADLKGKLADQAKAGGYSVNARSSFGDGIWLVGEEIQPGTYRSPAGGSCYWARLSGFGGFDDIIINGGFTRNQTVTISASDKGFESSNCGTWVKIG